MKKNILTLFIISTLVVLAGCSSAPTSVNTNVGNTEVLNENEGTSAEGGSASDGETNENTSIAETALEESKMNTNSNADTSDWLTYESKEYGFGFRYPKKWGEITINKEGGCLGQEELKNDQDPCEHVTFTLPKLGDAVLFLATQSDLYTQYTPGRGAYWGDKSSQIISLEYVVNYCVSQSQTECKVYTNSTGVTVAKNVEDIGFNQAKATMYYIRSVHPVYFGIVLSSDRLQKINSKNAENQLDELVDSFYYF